MLKNRIVIVTIGLMVSAAFVYLAARGLDLEAVEAAFAHAHLWPWLPLGIASCLAGHLARGARCRLLVRRHARIGLGTATSIVVVGYAANNVLPARLGELVRSGMLAERAGMPLAQSVTVTVIERILDGLILLLLLVIATVTIDVAGWMQDLVRAAVVAFGLAAIFMFAAALAPQRLIALASGAGQRLGTRWQARVVGLATSVTNAGACLRSPRDAALLFAYGLLVWVLDAGLYVMLLPAFDLPMTWQFGVATMCVTGFGLLLPSSPGSIGPYHYFASKAMVAFGTAPATALAYATLVHLAAYIPVTIWGVIAMTSYGIRLSAVVAKPRTADPVEAAVAEVSVSTPR